MNVVLDTVVIYPKSEEFPELFHSIYQKTYNFCLGKLADKHFEWEKRRDEVMDIIDKFWMENPSGSLTILKEFLFDTVPPS